MGDVKNAHLEDFGARDMASPQERYEQYVRDCKALPKLRQAEFWLKIIKHDIEVGRLVKKLGDGALKGDKRRRY
jgi:ABC-type uncharacterized transport system ATPase subunit